LVAGEGFEPPTFGL